MTKARDIADSTKTLDVDGGTIKLDGNYPVGTANVALGDAALDDGSLSGSYNTALGAASFGNLTSGTANLAVGAYAGQNHTTGSYNVFVGEEAAVGNTTGSSNTAVGRTALYSNTTAPRNTAVGYQSLYANTTGDNNTAIGEGSGKSNTTGHNNSFLGQDAGEANTTGQYNVAVGSDALQANTTANNSTAVGFQAGYTGTTNADGTYVGYQAGYSRTGSGNTCVGNYSGRDGTTGTDNTFVGRNSGYTITSGSKNTIIGMYNGTQGSVDIRTSSNNIVLSDGDGNPRLRIGSTGAATMGGASYDSTKTLKLQNVDQNSAGSYAIQSIGRQTGANGRVHLWNLENTSNSGAYFVYAANEAANVFNIRGTGNVQNLNNSYGSSSDVKLKENIVDASSQWDDIKALTIRKYSFISENLDAPNQLGVIAQELESSGMSGLVETNADIDPHTGEDFGTTTKAVKYSILYMKAVKALQEAMTRIETLETQNASFEARITALEGA